MPPVWELWNQLSSEELQSRDNNTFRLRSYDSVSVSRTPTISGTISNQQCSQQREHSSRVPEQHSFTRLEPPFAAVGEKAAPRFAGVDRIQQYAFHFGKELCGFARLCGRHSVAFADKIIVDV